ncbi:Uracil phosphoribosyltransferase, synthesizes UMP from uracil [Clonorchis sinensis]|uniref:Uracil phosphoribosyltransferase, synthesizes UMP from uracil n=2 Tax=Clonorchis sinensis TaxID=79923 RepID=A0A8T1MR31_CLOSI|nr:Uracil phosphoribosyltransferase, synthesizes UMP from uracil [Clonorchis sinensis]GAA56439.1 furin [Clonorchis sinensis]
MIIWLIMNFRLVPSKAKRHGWISHAAIFLLCFMCATVALPPLRSLPFTNNSMTFADEAAQPVSESGSPIFTRYWAVEILEGEEVAREVAEKHGFIFLGTILPGIYYMKQPRLSRRSVHHSIHYHDQLANDPRVVWLEQQVAKVRVKRDVHIPVNDPHWADMWYLNRGGPNGLDMNVRSAWARGYAGQDVVVTILDDGLEIDHPDLKENYDPFASYDVNGNDANPEPRYPSSDKNPASNRHGTRCAGEVAAVANNSICGLGIAYRARIGGVRMLDGDVSDAMESRSLGYQLQHIDVYSASWGPEDDGKTVDGPGRLAQMAFRNGIVMGRGGLGSIFVWASGNGGKNGDNCNCDGYTNSIYTLGVSSVSERGSVPWYAEMCSSTLAVTYSSGGQEERGVITTDLNHTCTRNHSGTSASAPLAAGICALTLSANKRLTWRDLQYLVVYTARPEGLNASDWRVNGVGRSVSHAFGYGLMDAGAMVDLAINWTNVPPQRVCEAQAPITGGPVSVQRMSKEVLALTTDGCASTAAFAGDPTQCVVYLEHVQAKVTVSSAQRGEIELRLTSPSGTESILLSKRPKDMDVAGFHAWPFMSVHFWGEMANGTWKLTVYSGKASVSIHDWILILYGTNTPPPLHASSHRRGVRQLPKNEVVSGIGSLHDNTGSRSVVLESRSSQPFQNHVHSSVLRPNHPLGFASSDSAQKDGHSVSVGKAPFPYAHVPRPQLPPPLPPPPPDPNDLWADWKPPSLKTHLPPLSSTLHLSPMQSQLLLDHIQSEAEVSDTAASKSSSDTHFTSVLHADWPQLPLLFNHQIFDHSGGDARYQDPLADVKESPDDNENRPTKKTGEMTSELPNIVAHQMPSESPVIPHSWFICPCALIVSFGLT